MSDSVADRFIAGGEEEARLLVEELLAAGGAATLAEALIAELAGETVWRRERVLGLLIRIPEAEQLLPHFSAALHEDTRADRRNGARSALTALASPASVICAAGVEALAELVHKPKDSDVRLLAAAALGESGNARARVALEGALRDTDVNVSSAAAESLGVIGDRRAVPALLTAVETGGFWTKAAAVIALGALRDPRAVGTLTAALSDPLLSSPAASALGEIGDASSLPHLAALLGGNAETREAALDSIAKILADNPDLDLGEPLRDAIAKAEPELGARLAAGEDVLAARLLGLSATETAIDLLLAKASPTGAPAAEVGLTAIPSSRRLDVLLPRLSRVDAEFLPILVGLLPPLREAAEVEKVTQLLGHESAAVREAASRVLGGSDADVVVDALIAALDQPERRTAAAIALSQACRRSAPFKTLLKDPEAQVRAAAADGLGRCGQELPELLAALREELHPGVRQRLFGAIGRSGGDAAVEALTEVLRTGSPAEQFSAATALGYTGSRHALDPLLTALTASAPGVRLAAINALGELGDSRAAAAVEGHLSDEHDRDVRRTAARAFDKLPDSGAAIERLAATAGDADIEVRLTAIAALARIGGGAALARLEQLADSEGDTYVRNAISKAVVQLREQLGTGRS